MAASPRRDPDFTITHEAEPSETLLAGFSSFALAGLTAVDYLVDHLDLEEQGHLSAEGLPTVTPFEEGRPRHHTRLFSRDDLDVTILVGELFVPVGAGRAFADAILDWTEANGVRDVAILSGVPIPHGPEEHRTYYIATDDYRERYLADDPIPPMGRGFLDGTNAALIERGLDSPLGVEALADGVDGSGLGIDPHVAGRPVRERRVPNREHGERTDWLAPKSAGLGTRRAAPTARRGPDRSDELDVPALARLAEQPVGVFDGVLLVLGLDVS